MRQKRKRKKNFLTLKILKKKEQSPWERMVIQEMKMAPQSKGI